jgi:hypothetical protein
MFRNERNLPIQVPGQLETPGTYKKKKEMSVNIS